MSVQVGYMKMWVNGRLKRWDEIGEKWMEEQGNEKGGKEEGREVRGRGDEVEEGRYKVAFWNVAGVKNKDVEFWKGLEVWDVLVLSGTWVEERDWERVRYKMP